MLFNGNGIVALDMGGTYIKYGVVSSECAVLCEGIISANSQDSREALLCRIAGAVVEGFSAAKQKNISPQGVAFSVPGPFNYADATSGMVGKYDKIYGIDLRKEIRHRAGLREEMPIEFMQDAAAFLVGEHTVGAAKGYTNCMCVTLGTGTGYACMLENKLLLNERKGPYYVLARQEYKNTGKLIEDIVSGVAILKNYGVDAKSLAKRAYNNDTEAIKIYRYLGTVLGEALREVPEIEKTECLVIGGQISKDFSLLYDGILDGLDDYASKISVVKAKHPTVAALIGSAVTLYN